MSSENKKYLFEQMPVSKAILSMAVPTVISQLINLVYSVVDTLYIGRSGNPFMMAGVTVSFTIFMMTIAFSNLFGVGGGSLIARLSGAGEEKQAKRVCAYSLYGAIVISLSYSLLIGVFLNPILSVLGASENTVGFARQYVLWVVVAGDLPMILGMTCSHLLRNSGYAKQASIGLSAGGILNIILDPLFMFVILSPGNEVLGAAIATFISNCTSCVYLVCKLISVSEKAPLSADFKEARKIRKTDIKALYAVGVPSAVLTGLFDVANIFLNKLMSLHGDIELAAIGIAMKIERLPNAINIGLCQGMLPIVAYNFSSGDTDRMRKTMSTARIYGLAVSFLTIILFQFFSAPVVNLFMKADTENAADALKTLEFAVLFVKLRTLAAPVQFMNYHSSFCMQAMGNGKGTLMHAILREIAFYIPFMFLLDTLFGVKGLSCALIAGEAAGALVAVLLLRAWMNRVFKKD